MAKSTGLTCKFGKEIMNKSKKNWTLIGIITIMLFIFLLGYMQTTKNRDKERDTEQIEEALDAEGATSEDVSSKSGEINTSEMSEEVISDDGLAENASLEGVEENNESIADETENIPSDSEADAQEKYIDFVMNSMSLHEKVCQMILPSFATLSGVNGAKISGDITKKALEDYPVCGIIYDSSNFESEEQTKQMLSDVKEFSKIPLILTLDEEGGRVARLMPKFSDSLIGPMFMYKSQGTETAYNNAAIIAANIKNYGFNMDMAPVADVWSNSANKVIGDRAYSDDYNEAAELVSAAVSGFHSGKVGCTLKHFPGHGDTLEDSHYGAAYVGKTLDELREGEFLPFKAGIDAGADAVMIGHLIVSDISDEPALFSKEIVTDILRGELGFEGVVITDSLQMKAMTDYYGEDEVAVRAIEAGCDILLMPNDIGVTAGAIEKAIEDGRLSEERINESVRRILRLKYSL